MLTRDGRFLGSLWALRARSGAFVLPLSWGEHQVRVLSVFYRLC